mmetsp:Transcript_49099/g.72946  ORF Transcript_49099/g.72946 Transcript_49099/m.72946 type:complete len:415 (-) Transcript_49099:82-1326(-)
MSVRATSEHHLGTDGHSDEDSYVHAESTRGAVVKSRTPAHRSGSRDPRRSSNGSMAKAVTSKRDVPSSEIAPGDVDVDVSYRQKQSIKNLMDELYESHTQQVGYQTDGHVCVHNADKQEALHLGASLLYGEVLFEGVSKMLSSQFLAAGNSDILYDLGMGTGKLAVQAFFEHPNLKHVVGVEIAFSRYNIAERAAVNLVAKYPKKFKLLKWTKGTLIAVATLDPKTGDFAPQAQRRVLEFRREDLFKSFDAIVADIIILQTDFPVQVHDSLCNMASRFRRGTRVLSYLNFHKIWDCDFFPFPFASFARNARFPTSWSPTNGGHMFYLWRKVMPAYKWHDRKNDHDESKFDGFNGLKKMSSLQFHKQKGTNSKSNAPARDEGGRAGSAKNVFKCIFHKKPKKGRSSKSSKGASRR